MAKFPVMFRRALFPMAALLAVALIAGSPAAQGKRKRPRPKPVTGSFTARAIPFPAMQETSLVFGASDCIEGIEGVTRASHTFRAPFSGVLKAEVSGFAGDWDLYLTQSHKKVDRSASDQIVAGTPAEERVSTR